MARTFAGSQSDREKHRFYMEATHLGTTRDRLREADEKIVAQVPGGGDGSPCLPERWPWWAWGRLREADEKIMAQVSLHCRPSGSSQLGARPRHAQLAQVELHGTSWGA